ncbi:helix-turn-helix transcriptional regulator [Paraburkholderia sp. BCC1886]|uniref:helix-turn-helix transcriptional regulator n=1 Tax=Paraburkholderia sp. BCC1886 TaxID=2562670 RepID=UPI001182BECC|nr:helix-turn-helix transcriptional regulator [Paraburkholderia sp. BCC1886]
MDYPLKTIDQLRPILLGFRKSAGLTQAAMASRLGVTQQTYAQLEANPAAVSVDRLFRVLRALAVTLTLVSTDTTEAAALAQAPLESNEPAGGRRPVLAKATKSPKAVSRSSPPANTTRIKRTRTKREDW